MLEIITKLGTRKSVCDKLGEDGIDWEEIVRETVPQKALDLNIKAFHAGRAAAGME